MLMRGDQPNGEHSEGGTRTCPTGGRNSLQRTLAVVSASPAGASSVATIGDTVPRTSSALSRCGQPASWTPARMVSTTVAVRIADSSVLAHLPTPRNSATMDAMSGWWT